jgi:hypothetical protein
MTIREKIILRIAVFHNWESQWDHVFNDMRSKVSGRRIPYNRYLSDREKYRNKMVDGVIAIARSIDKPLARK